MYGYLVAFLMVVAIAAGSYFQGRADGAAHVQLKWDAAIIAARNATEADRKAQEDKARKLSRRYEAKIATQATVNREISDALERALGKANLPASCNLDDGLLDAWNAANRGESKPAGKLPDAASSVTGAKVKVD